MKCVDISQEAIALLLMSALLRETCGAAWALKIPEDAFLAAMQMAYREYLPQMEKMFDKRKRPAQGAKPGV